MHFNLIPIRPTSAFARYSMWIAALLFSQAAFGQTNVREPDRTPTRDNRVVRPGERVKLKNPDRSFVEKVARMSMEEADISRVAAQRTSNPRVRALAEAMAESHSAMGKELALIASDKGVVVPAKENFGEKWLKRDGKNFDVEYLKKIVEDHKDTVEHFQKQARDGHDPELVAFARKYLSSIQHHLQEASDLHKMMK